MLNFFFPQITFLSREYLALDDRMPLATPLIPSTTLSTTTSEHTTVHDITDPPSTSSYSPNFSLTTSTSDQTTDSQTTNFLTSEPPPTNQSTTSYSTASADTTNPIGPTYQPTFQLPTNLSEEEKGLLVRKIKKDLFIDHRETSAFKMTKISKWEDRPSSNMIGVSGIVMLVVCGVLIILPDVLTIIHHVIGMFSRTK